MYIYLTSCPASGIRVVERAARQRHLSGVDYINNTDEQTMTNKEIQHRVIVVAVSMLFANFAYYIDMGKHINPY